MEEMASVVDVHLLGLLELRLEEAVLVLSQVALEWGRLCLLAHGILVHPLDE